MSSFYLQITVLSSFVLVFTLVSKYTKDKLHLPESFISLIFGILVGKNFLYILKVNPYGLFSISRMILCLQTMNVALSLPMRYVFLNYKSLLVLVILVGFIKCIFTFLLLHFFRSLSVLQCWQLASALTPTDPILCSSIIKSRLKIPNRLRLLLLAESGINDGLGIILLSIPNNTSISRFLYNILYHKILLSTTCGIILGMTAKTFFKFCYRKSLVGMDSFIIHTFLLVLVSIGIMEILEGSEFICIFMCGIQFSSDEFISIEYDRNMQETVDLLVSTTFFVIFGSTLDLQFTVKELLISLIIICIRRPVICYVLRKCIENIRSKKEALFIGWFGPIGVGAIYYSMMVDIDYHNGLYYYASKIVLLSVCVHGVSILLYRIFKKLYILIL
ncbi:NA+/H+ ANTIPORTER [Vairimorpha necatrix]|uniref:NA+/H+ ANTIPORTER n=1 Tax=Vairimorpha necatrix TaxID=6039 RepID=A0AAX4JG13_9MICR